jgi:hypothetical protein
MKNTSSSKAWLAGVAVYFIFEALFSLLLPWSAVENKPVSKVFVEKMLACSGLLAVVVAELYAESSCAWTETVGCYADCSYASCRILQTEVAGTQGGGDVKMSHE